MISFPEIAFVLMPLQLLTPLSLSLSFEGNATDALHAVSTVIKDAIEISILPANLLFPF